jgi:hypothetical protein
MTMRGTPSNHKMMPRMVIAPFNCHQLGAFLVRLNLTRHWKFQTRF